MIRNYLVVAWRHIQRNRIFSIINVFGLAVGLTCCLLISLYIWHESTFDQYHKNASRLYQVGTDDFAHGKEYRFWGTPSTLAGIFQNIYPEVELTARMEGLLSEDKTLLQYGSDKAFYEERGFMVDSGFFRLFTYAFVEGSPTNAISGPYSIVLSREIARKLFGNEPALGKIIHVTSASNGEHDYTVTGVFVPAREPSHIDGRFFLSMYGGYTGDFIRTNKYTAANYSFVTYIRLRPGADPRALEGKFPAFVENYEGKDLRAAGFWRKHFLLPVRDIHLHANMPYGDVTPSGNVAYLYILATIGLFTLLIACVNFMNLSTARASKRSAEIGVRKTLGAGRSSLVRQFLSESVLMAMMAFGLSLLFAYVLKPAFEQVTGVTLYVSGPAAAGFCAVFLVVALITGLLAGSYPALYLASFRPVKVLKGKMANSLAVASVRKGLVVFQFTISTMLIAASVIIARQMHYMRTADLGFKKDRQITIPLRGHLAQQQFTALRTEWLKNPNVSSVAGSVFYPGGYRPGWDAAYFANGKTAKDASHTYLNCIDFDYMKTLGLQALAGRIFSSGFATDSVDGVVLNEAAARRLGYTAQSAIGQRIFELHAPSPNIPLTVVGVVRDFHFMDFHNQIDPMAFEVFSAFDHFSFITVHLERETPATIAELEKSWKALVPDEPFEFHFLDAEFMQHYAADDRLEAMVGWATGVAICISCLGLFGLAAFSAEQRRKEIGIRKVLGAGQGRIAAMLSKDFLKLVGLAIIIGSPVAWFAMNRWLEAFAYRTNVSWTVFAATAFVAIFIAGMTVSFQAVRAAIANPVDSLRTE